MNGLTRRLAKCSLSKTVIAVGLRSENPILRVVGQARREQSCRLLSSIARYSNLQTLSVSTANFSSEVKTLDDFEINASEKFTTSKIFTDSGAQYGMLLDTRKLPKLKPSIVQRRLARCKIYEGKEKAIRQSPWKLNRICQLAAGLTLEEALTQLKFCDLKNADLVAKVLKRTSNLADIRDGLQISQLEVAECFATKAMMLRRIKTMGRGRCVMEIAFAEPFSILSSSLSSFNFTDTV